MTFVKSLDGVYEDLLETLELTYDSQGKLVRDRSTGLPLSLAECLNNQQSVAELLRLSIVDAKHWIGTASDSATDLQDRESARSHAIEDLRLADIALKHMTITIA